MRNVTDTISGYPVIQINAVTFRCNSLLGVAENADIAFIENNVVMTAFAIFVTTETIVVLDSSNTARR